MDYRICRSPVPAVPEAYQADQARHGKLREAKGGKVSWASVWHLATSVFSSQVVSGCWQGKYERIDIEAHSTLLESFFSLPGRHQLVCKDSKSQNWGRLRSQYTLHWHSSSSHRKSLQYSNSCCRLDNTTTSISYQKLCKLAEATPKWQLTLIYFFFFAHHHVTGSKQGIGATKTRPIVLQIYYWRIFVVKPPLRASLHLGTKTRRRRKRIL